MKKVIYILCFLSLYFGQAQKDTIAVFYDIGKYKLTTNHIAKIESEITKLDPNINFHVQIISSCDYLGSNKNNLILSSKRAEAVRDLLLTKNNLIITSIKYKGVGELSTQIRKRNGIKNHRRTCIIIKTETQYIFDNMVNSNTGDVFILKNIIFDPGRHLLKKQSIPVIKQLLNVLENHPKLKIEISGHICCGKNPKDSLDGFDKDTKTYFLSKNRAKHIYNYLILKKIDSSRLVYKGYGFSNPLIFPEATKIDQLKNRRVEIRVISN